MKFKGTNKIITEDDIILSDGSSTLSERLSSQQSEIDQLKSNVKWIYKYGGIGSGGGGGSSQQLFSIYATLNDILLKDLNIVLDGLKSYPLYIKINNPNGDSFNVKYSYTSRSNTGGNVTQSQTVILSIENNYTLLTSINLNNNDILTIVATNGNDTQLVSCNYITSPYIFNVGLVNNSLESLQSEIFISNAERYGVNVKLDYLISIGADIQYKYTFNGEEITGSILDKNNSLIFQIPKDLFISENAGYYTANITLTVIPDNQNPVELKYDVTFNLVPEDLYLLVIPDNGVIYKEELKEPYLYNPGYITFNYRVYEGVNNNRTYNVKFRLNNEEAPRQYSVTERLLNSLKVFTIKAGVNTLDVTVTRATTYTYRYYFYVAESTLQLNWLDWQYLHYYRISETTSQFSLYLNKSYISLTVNSDPIEFTDIPFPEISGDSVVNTHVAIGLQYSAINGDNPIILQFFNSQTGDVSVLDIKLSNIEKEGEIKDFYINKLSNAKGDEVDLYHLILIYSKFVKRDGNEFYYSLQFYIDGTLEATYSKLTNYPLNINSFRLNNVNCFINLLEVDYKDGNLTSNCDHEVYQYYLKYKNTILGYDVADLLQLKEYLSGFNVGLDGRVTTDKETINNIALYISTPVLLMTCQDNNNDIMINLEKNYGEDGSGAGSDFNFDTTISWSPGNSSVEPIEPSSEYTNAQFNAAIQGSSTKAYRVKNFELSLVNKDEGGAYNYLYSPNFKYGDTSTFLPEKSFTLKADVVDSGHSNNTSCGKFVNTVCRSTNYYINDTSRYSGYIKNCLIGFPILLFLETVYTDPITSEETHTYYYLGIYNFNLGRLSYYNLGYKDLSIFGTLLNDAGNSFTFFQIDKNLDILREGLEVAEIQGGSPYFDFSLYDSSILFLQSLSGSTDNTYMFGDLVYGSNTTELQLKTDLQNFVNKVALSGGYLFNYLKKNFGLQTDGYTAEKTDESGSYTGESLNQVPDYHKLYKRELSGSQWKYSIKEIINDGTLNDLQELIIPDIDTGKMLILDYLSISEYYVLCMVLGLVDNVLKNLNIKKWKNSPFMAEFYDMDSGLGWNNRSAKTGYFAFSDYWHSQYTTTNDIDNPTNVRIYRDFSPHSLGENGYDIPSSYLFAVAKYAKLIFPEDKEYLKDYPQQLYSKWRSNTVNTETQEGVLKNADYFMENFFSNNLKSINPVLISYNYRSKYLKIEEGNTLYVNIDYEKFNGTHVNQVRDWLEGRLHILDAYFNLNTAISNSILYLDNEEWKDLTVSGLTIVDCLPDGSYSYSTNTDVVILRDIFSSSDSAGGVQLSGTVDINIKCPEYSPLQIYNANGSILLNYILGGEREQHISFKTTGVLIVKLGGSQAWTYLLNINWVNATSLYINSDKLENITGSQGSFSGIKLNTPNVNTIDLTSVNYIGSLSLSESENYPNLKSINISGTKMGLTAKNLNVQSINLSNMNSTNLVIITGCNKLTSLTCANTKLSLLRVIGLQGILKNFILENTKITSLDLQCSETSGSSITINNDTELQSLSLSGFETVTISNCPKLYKVSFSQGNVKSISITACKNAKLAITSKASTVDNVVDLSTLPSLEKLNLNGCTYIKNIYLPDNVTLVDYACSSLYNLETIDGNNIQITGYRTFLNCNKYGLKDSNGNYTDLHVLTTATTLLLCFYKSSNNITLITIDDVKHFIEYAIPSGNSITNVSEAFRSNQGIIYGLDQLKEDLAGGSNYIDLTKLNKVTIANGMFYNCNITAYYKGMWNFGGSSLSLKYFCEPFNKGIIYDTKTIYTTIDLLTNVISKVTYLFDTGNNNRYTTTFVDNSGNVITDEIQLKDFFNPNGVSPSKLIELSRFYLNSTLTFDLTDIFTSGWTSLTTISEFLWIAGLKYKGLNYLFYNLPKITKLYDVLRDTTLDVRSDLWTIFNWETYLLRAGRLFSDCSSDSYDTGTFLFKKEISASNYIKLCNLLLKSTITEISYLFSNCNILDYYDIFTFGSLTTTNETIKYIRGLYLNCKIVNSNEIGSMNLSSTFFTNFKSIADVRYAFQECIFSAPIPFNFFNKRLINYNDVRNVYVKVGDEYKEALLTTYTYRADIYCYTNLFYNCLFVNQNNNFYDPSRYNIERNTVLSEGNEYTTYYTRLTIINEDESVTYNYIEHTLTLPTEITDAESLTGYYISTAKVDSTHSYQNALIDATYKDYLCIPPDIFYGTKTTTDTSHPLYIDYSYALSFSTRILGIIPEHLFKVTGKVSNTFLNLSIIPRLVYSSETTNLIINVYTHYPSNYTQYSDLNLAFTSRYVVPVNEEVGGKLVINWVFIILENTIPNSVISLQEAFNCTDDFGGIYHGLNKDDNNYINCVGKISNDLVIEGLDMNVFTNLKLDKVYYTNLSMLSKGKLFNSSFKVENSSFLEPNTYIMDPGFPNDYNLRISLYLVFPDAQKDIPRFIYPTANKYYIKSNLLINTASLDYYSNIFTIDDNS